MRIVVEFEWEQLDDIGLTPTNRLSFPQIPAEPGIYQFRITGADGDEVYIGESSDLKRRMLGNYASTHTGTTNVRVREMLTQHLLDGRRVQFSIIRQAGLEVDGETTVPNLSQKPMRLIVENAALVVAQQAGDRIHNLQGRRRLTIVFAGTPPW